MTIIVKYVSDYQTKIKKYFIINIIIIYFATQVKKQTKAINVEQSEPDSKAYTKHSHLPLKTNPNSAIGAYVSAL